MRTAAIQQACARFEAQVAPRLGAAVGVTDTRVTFDATGGSVSCRALTAEGSAELRVGDAGRWHVAGPNRAALASCLDDPRVADAVARLRAEVGPQLAHREPLTGARARDLLGADGERLADTIDAYARYYGQPLQAVWLDGDDMPSVGYPPIVTDQEILMFAPPPFRQDAHVVAYLEDLGFAVDARSRVYAVPVPSAFARRRSRLGVDGGLTPELRVLRATLYSPRAWLGEIARGVFPMNVHGRLARGFARAARRLPLHRSQRAKLNNHFHALGHDMGMHTLALHRVPRRRMAELRRLARVALSRGRARPAASFFEERLTRACVEAWAEVTRPSDFEVRFAVVYPALRAELAGIAHG